MSATRKLVLGTLALAAVAVAVAVTFQLVHGSRAATQQGAPAVPVTVATVVQTNGSRPTPRDRQRRAVHVRRGQGARRRTDRRGPLQGRRRGQAGRDCCSRSIRVPSRPRCRQAQANLQKDKALLDHAVEQEKRYKDLLEKNFISTDAYEQVRTNARHGGGDGRSRRGGDREREAVARLLHDPLAGDRLRGPDPDPAGQPGQGQRHQPAGDDQSGRPDLRVVLGARAEPRDIRKYQATGDAARSRPRFGQFPRTRRSRASSPRRQRRRHRHRHDPAARRVREPRQGALAGPVRQRRADALRAEGRDRGAVRPRCRTAPTASTCSSSSPT